MANVGTGNVILDEDDMTVPHKGVALAYRRTYNSQSGHDVNGSDGSWPTLQGNGWTTTWDAHLSGDPAHAVTVWDIDGSRYDYTLASDGATWLPPPGQHASLTSDGGCGMLWTKKTGTTYYFYALNGTSTCSNSIPLYGGYGGRLYSIIGRNSNTWVHINYYWENGFAGPTGKLTALAGLAESGLQAYITLSDFNGHRLAATLSRPDGTLVSYQYDGNGNLTSVGSPSNGSGPTTIWHTFGYGSASNGATYLAWAASPRWANSAANDGSYAYFGVQPTGNTVALSSIGHVGWINPSINDGVSSGPVQATMPTGVVQYLFETYVTNTMTPSLSDTDGHMASWTVDGAGRPLQTRECTASQGQQCTGLWLTSSEAWDANNNLVATVEPRGYAPGGSPAAYETDYAYDANGNAVAVAAPAATVQTPSGAATTRPTKLFSYELVNGVNYNNVTAYCDEVWSQAHGRDWETTGNPGPSDSLCPVSAGSPAAPTVPTFAYQHPSYEPFGELSSSVSALGYQKTYLYPQQANDFGMPTDVSGASFLQIDGKTPYQSHQTFGYDQNGNLTSYGTGSGTWSLTYDGMNRVTVQIDPDGYSSYRSYYPDGSLSRTETPAQHAANAAHAYAFDAAVAYAYDSDGNPTSETDHHSDLAGVTHKWYDGADRLLEVQAPRDARSFTDGIAYDYVSQAPATRYLYDLSANGQVSFGTVSFRAYGNRFADQRLINGNWTSVRGAAFDGLDRSVTDYRWSVCGQQCTPAVKTISQQYDVPADPATGAPRYGLLATKSNAAGQSATYRYDARASNAEVDYSGAAPAAPNRTYQYDPAGRAVSISEAGVGTQRYTYDVEGKKTQSAEPSGINSSAALTYSYYPNGSRSSLSVASATLTQHNLITYIYRNDGEKTAQTLSANGYNGSFGWTYTPAGRLLQRSDPYGNPSEVRTYDGTGGLSTEQLGSSGGYSVGQYDDEGDVQSWSFAGPGVTAYSEAIAYNVRGELVGERTADGSHDREQQAADGLMITRLDTISSPDIRRYETGTPDFDLLNGLFLSWNAPSPNGGAITTTTSKTWGFDAAGRESGFAATLSKAPNMSCSKWVVLEKDTQNSVYDFENHLVSQNSDSGAWQSAPKPCGTAPQLVDPSTTTYVYGPDGHALTKTDQPGSSVTYTYTSLHWDGDQLLFTAMQNGTSSGPSSVPLVDVKMGTDADVTFGGDSAYGTSSSYSGITVNDRDPAGVQVNQHNTTGYGTWSPADAYATVYPVSRIVNPNFLAPNYMMNQPRPDGVSDGINILQGVRVYDPSLHQWATPDAYAGTISDPGTRREYMWNRNNPYAYTDPSGYDAIPKDATQLNDDWQPTKTKGGGSKHPEYRNKKTGQYIRFRDDGTVNVRDPDSKNPNKMPDGSDPPGRELEDSSGKRQHVFQPGDQVPGFHNPVPNAFQQFVSGVQNVIQHLPSAPRLPDILPLPIPAPGAVPVVVP